MNYQDTSSLTGTDARSDADVIPAGSKAPAVGNTITGAGTTTGASGADVVGTAPGHVVAVQGAGGGDTSASGEAMQVSGRYGVLNMEADGSYRYARNGDTPDGVRDVFTYTLADAGDARDTATLTIEIGRNPVVVQANAQQVVPGPDGLVTLPAGVTLADVHVVGRNLVIDMPDGTQMIIVDGAVFVPQLVLGGVEVPSSNLAALLIDSEPVPAAGNPQSGGGNFGLPPGPLDPGVPLGDLVPPVEQGYEPPIFEDVGQFIDDEPEIFIQPDGQPASVAAIDQVDERGLPSPRLNNANEPAGSGEGSDGNGTNNSDAREITDGTIIIDAKDTPTTITITVNGVTTAITGTVPQVIQGQYGTLTINSVSDTAIDYTYVLRDNTSGDNTHDDFLVTLTDNDGDQASATLRIDIIDDVPTARPDTDSIAAGQFGPATGNVITDAAAGDVGDSDTNAADTVGADNATITLVSSVNVPANTDNSGPFVVNGQYGVLTLQSNGDYSYVRNAGTPGGVVDTFNYTLTDGDGDTSTTTLTINIGDLLVTVGQNPIVRSDDDAVPGENGNPGGPEDNVDAQNLTGTLSGSGGDGALTFDLLTTGAPAGFTYVDGPNGSVLVQQVQNGSPVTVLTITINAATGAYTVTQNNPILHPTLNGQAGDDTENNVSFTLNYTVTDIDLDSASGTLTIDVDDDTPVVTQALLTGTVDEDGVPGGNPGGVNDVAGEGASVNGSVAALFSAGADNPLTYSLLTNTSGLPALTSNGATVTYSVSGNTLTASANGSPVFTFTVNATTGAYTFTLLDQLDHPSLNGQVGDDTENPTASDLTIALGSIIQATDADGDSVTAPANGLVITVDDDSPLPFVDCPEDVISVNDAGFSFTGDLNLPPVGADAPGTVTFGVSDGDPVLDNEGNPVTAAGEDLFYFINAQGVLEARVGGETGDLIFTITLNSNGTFTYQQVGTLGEGGLISFENLTSTSAGNALFAGVGAGDPATTVDLLLTAEKDGASSTINTDSDSIGSANQSMDVGETVRIDFVSNLTAGGGTPSGFSYGNHVSSTSFLGLIPQVQGSQDATTAFTVWALNSTNTSAAEPDRNPAGGFADASVTAITTVTVKDYLSGNSTTVDVTGFTPGVFTAVAYGISVRVNGDGSVTFSGIQEGDSYGFDTGAGEFNAVAVQSDPAGTGGSTQDSFDLGVFSIGVANEFQPVDLSIPVALTDADGDSVVCDIDLHIGAPLDANDVTVTVNEAGLPIGSNPGSTSETQGGNLQGQVSGGTGPYTFALAVGESANGTYGNLTLNSNGTFSYTLDTPFDSQPDANDGTNPELGADTFDVVATDSLGATQTLTINVNIIDDVPSTQNDTDVTSPLTDQASGNVVTDASPGDVGDTDTGADTFGADRPGTVTALTSNNVPANADTDAGANFSVAGQYGNLVMNSDGSYTYTRAGGTPGGAVDVFTYTLTDADGDAATATLTITIADNTPALGTPAIAQSDDEIFAGGNAGGTADANPNTANLTGNLAGSGGDGALTYAFTGVNTLPAGFTVDPSSTATSLKIAQAGVGIVATITLNTSTGAYTIVQNLPVDHPTPGTSEEDVQFLIGVKVSDIDGDSATNTLTINIDDDTPLASPDTDTVAAGTATGNVITDAAAGDAGDSDTGADSPGADGFDRITNLAGALTSDGDPTGGFVANGNYGQLVMDANGNYTYTRSGGLGGGQTEVFTYTYRDGDGDAASSTLTITIPDATPALGTPLVAQSDDEIFAGGNAGGTADANPNTANLTGNLAGSGGDGALTYAFTGVNTLPAGFTVDPSSTATSLKIAQAGVGIVATITLNTSTGAYTIVQNLPVDHPTPGTSEEDVQFLIGVKVSDIDGDSATNTLTINIDDDTPLASPDTDTVAAGTATGNVITDAAAGDAGDSDTGADSPGADGFGAITNLVGAVSSDADPTAGFVANGNYGQLVMDANGNYTYTRSGGLGGGQSEVFTYTYTDGDGDAASSTLTITIPDATPALGTPLVAQSDDEIFAGGNAGGTADANPNTANLTGNLAGSGGDGALTYAFTGVNTLPAGFTVDPSSTATVLKIAQAGVGIVATITLNTSTGAYTIVQDQPVDHPTPGTSEEDVQFLIGVKVSDIDGDSATNTLTINIDDDTPVAAVAETVQTVSLDESVGIQIDSQDTTNAGVIALFAGVANKGTDTDLPQYATSASGLVSSTGSSYGADGAGTTAFSLNVSAAGVDSGLNTTSGQDILLFKEGSLIIGRVSGGPDNGKAAFAIAIDPVTGVVSTVEYLSIQHVAGNPDDSVSIADGAVVAITTVTDSDGDSVASTPVGIGSQIQFQDSGPVMTSAQNINIQNAGDFAHTGAFVFNLGADGAATNNNVLSVTGSATVNGAAVTNYSLTETSEDANTAVYSLSFNYANGTGTPALATGTVTFNKAAGTWTVDMNQALEGVSIVQTATGTDFTGYDFGTSNETGSQPDVAVTQLRGDPNNPQPSDLFIQFTSVSEPSSGTGDDNLEVTSWVPGVDNPAPIDGGGDTSWSAGQVFNQEDGWVSASGSANGVNGDTIGGGEVLDFNLFQGANPTGILSAPTATATTMFLKFDGISDPSTPDADSAEDLIVILKLYDTVAQTYTTKALIVQNSDIQKGPGTGPTGFTSITLDENDGLIIIQPNDYQEGNANLVIVGAQIVDSPEGVSGTGINFNNAIGTGATGASVGTEAFSTDNNDGPLKISSIGFVTTSTTAQTANLTFNVTVTDGDGDSILQTVTATITANADGVSAATIPAANTTVAQAPISTKGTASVSDTYDAQQQAANSNTVLLGAIAGAGLMSTSAAAEGLSFDTSTPHLDGGFTQSSLLSSTSMSTVDYRGAMPSVAEVGHAFSSDITTMAKGSDVQEMLSDLSLAGSAGYEAPALSQLAQGYDMPVVSQSADAAPFAGAELAMPGIEALAASVAQNGGNAPQAGVVAQVLADALAGGGDGPNIDGLLAQLPGGSGVGLMEVLASQHSGGVPAWDMGAFGGFTAIHQAFTMETLVLHQDAVVHQA